VIATRGSLETICNCHVYKPPRPLSSHLSIRWPKYTVRQSLLPSVLGQASPRCFLRHRPAVGRTRASELAASLSLRSNTAASRRYRSAVRLIYGPPETSYQPCQLTSGTPSALAPTRSRHALMASSFLRRTRPTCRPSTKNPLRTSSPPCMKRMIHTTLSH
jgi:hypothetical protein